VSAPGHTLRYKTTPAPRKAGDRRTLLQRSHKDRSHSRTHALRPQGRRLGSPEGQADAPAYTKHVAPDRNGVSRDPSTRTSGERTPPDLACVAVASASRSSQDGATAASDHRGTPQRSVATRRGLPASPSNRAPSKPATHRARDAANVESARRLAGSSAASHNRSLDAPASHPPLAPKSNLARRAPTQPPPQRDRAQFSICLPKVQQRPPPTRSPLETDPITPAPRAGDSVVHLQEIPCRALRNFAEAAPRARIPLRTSD